MGEGLGVSVVSLPTSYSLASSSALCMLTFAAMQVFKDELSTEGGMTILGGFIGSWFFIFLITIAGNLGSILLGDLYYVRVFPEVIGCLIVAMVVAGSVHRVCATTCVIFSVVALYFINKISQSTYASSATARPQKSLQKSTSRSSGKAKNK